MKSDENDGWCLEVLDESLKKGQEYPKTFA